MTFIVFSSEFPNGANCPGECVKNPDMIVRSPEDDSVDVGDNGSVGVLLYWMMQKTTQLT